VLRSGDRSGNQAVSARACRANAAFGTSFVYSQRPVVIAAAHTHSDRQGRQLLATEVPSTAPDPFLPGLEERLNNLASAGFDAAVLVRSDKRR